MGENNEINVNNSEKVLKFDPNKKYPLTWSYMFSYSFRQTSNNKCYFCLCLFSCLIVSVIALVANTILAEGPIIFVLVGEGNTGERDFIVKPIPIEIEPKSSNLDNMVFYSELNYTNFLINHPKTIENFKLEDFSTYRFETSVNVRACHKNKDSSIEKNCKELQSNFYSINSLKEEKMKLGRSYDIKKNKINEGECILHEVLTERLNLNYKEQNVSLSKESALKKEIEININLKGILKNMLVDKYTSNKFKISEDEEENIKVRKQNLEKINKIALFNSTYKCIVKNTIETPLGKVNGDTKNLIIYESEYFFKSIAEGLNKEIIKLFPDFQNSLKLSKISDRANTIIINFPDDRLKNYLYSSFELLNKRGVEFIDKVLTKIEENISVSKPLIDEMEELFFGAVFFGLILNLVIIIMFSLSIILIYSLLLITMETSTFDLGMMRLIGGSKFSLLIITIIQCIFFSLPAFLIGYILHFFVLSAVSYQLSQSSGSDISLKQDTFSVVYSFLLCNLAPLISAYFPIKGMIGKNLADSISTNNSKTSGVKVSVVSSINREKKILITFGLLTVIYGISIYYFLPLSLLSMNFSLLLAIFLWILLGMLIGLIIFTLNLEYLTQKIFTFIFFFWTSTYIRTLVIKNLIAHRLRNRKTSLMFSLSVGFFIMISVGAKLEITSTNLRVLSRRGAEINLVSRGEHYSTAVKLNPDLEKLKSKKLIEEYSYITPLLSTLCDSSTSIMNIGKSSKTSVDVRGISANFYNSTINTFLTIVDEGYHYNDMKKYINPSEWLYAVENDGRFGLSDHFTKEINLKIEDEFILYNERKEPTEYMINILKPSFFLSSSPAINFSSTNNVLFRNRVVIVPMHVFSDMLNKCSNFFDSTNPKATKPSTVLENMPIGEVLIKTSKEDKESIKEINSVLSSNKDYSVSTWVYAERKSDLDKTRNFISMLFSMVALVILIFCFFNLTASMSINMYEQQKEIAVFRSQGLTKGGLKLIYVIESFILIVSSCFLGLITGTILSWTSLIQRIYFTNLPLQFEFPYIELSFLILFAVIGGFLSTFFTARKISEKQICSLIKSG